jgi:hypothetical protein
MRRVNTLFRLRLLAFCLVLPAVTLLSGCNAIQVRVGLKVSLPKLQVTSMSAALNGDPGIAPGERSGIIAKFVKPDGKVLVTQGKGKGKVLWQDLKVDATVVSVNKKGTASLPQDPRISDGKTGHITITVPSHPDLKADFDVPLRYDYPFVADFSGASGSNGTNGTNGATGSSGSSGSSDPANPSPGGDGGNGGNGTDGGDGGDGGDADDVKVRMTLRPGAHPLLEVGVAPVSGGTELFYLVDPSGGTLTVLANGGAGGSGGSGGSGGAGGSGGPGIPPGNSGSNGTAGRDGFNGSPGRPGSITVTYDPSAAPFLDALKLVNEGGPKPTLTQATVPLLW